MVFEVKDVKEDGGLLEIFDAEKSLSLVLAHHALESGLFAKNSKGQIVRLSRMITHPPTEPAAAAKPGKRPEKGRPAAKPAPPTEGTTDDTDGRRTEGGDPTDDRAGPRMKEGRTEGGIPRMTEQDHG